MSSESEDTNESAGMLASGSMEEISLGIVVFHADGTSTDYGIVSRTNFKEQAEAEAEALTQARQDKGILSRLGSIPKKLRGKGSK